jgi:phage terminase large subunit GpA-like protein
MSNTRPYEIGTIPDLLSAQDGNGEILLLTCAADINGVVDDARLDYEIKAHSASGSTYSIAHGSIGTFLPGMKQKDRESDKAREKPMTYRWPADNSVWDLFDEVLRKIYPTQSGKKQMIIAIAGVDSGYLATDYVYPYIDRWQGDTMLVALKTKDKDTYVKTSVDEASFAYGKERNDLYIVRSNMIKDATAARMRLTWNRLDELQPPGFMNYPSPAGTLYDYEHFFRHYEAEEYVVETRPGKAPVAQWRKKQSNSQNHLWDCHVYNMALRDIWITLAMKEFKLPKATWADYVQAARLSTGEG